MSVGAGFEGGDLCCGVKGRRWIRPRKEGGGAAESGWLSPVPVVEVEGPWKEGRCPESDADQRDLEHGGRDRAIRVITSSRLSPCPSPPSRRRVPTHSQPSGQRTANPRPSTSSSPTSTPSSLSSTPPQQSSHSQHPTLPSPSSQTSHTTPPPSHTAHASSTTTHTALRSQRTSDPALATS